MTDGDEPDPRDRFEDTNRPIFSTPLDGHTVTFNEWHAVGLSATSVFGGASFAVGALLVEDDAVVAGTLLVALGAVYAMLMTAYPIYAGSHTDASECEDAVAIGKLTIVLEPWWFVAVFVVLWILSAVGTAVVL